MVKIKLKDKKKLYEAVSSSVSNVDLNIKKRSIDDSINDIWNDLMKNKKVQVKKLYGSALSKSGIGIPLGKMNKVFDVNIEDIATGKKYKDSINPKEIAAFCDMARVAAMQYNKKLSVVLSRFDKPIIWTLNNVVPTAATDGNRVAFNVAFALSLLNLGKAEFKAAGSPATGSQAAYLIGKYFLFVLVHEAYHQLYRHSEQEKRKPETENGKYHSLANVAQDVEINRDIENQIPEIFTGAVKKTKGLYDSRFPIQTWYEIFKAYLDGKAEPPKSEKDSMNNSSMNNMDDSDDLSSSNSDNQSNDSQDTDSQDSNDNNADSQKVSNSKNSKNQNSNGSDDSSDSDDDSEDSFENPNLDGKSDTYKKAYADALKKELDKIKKANGQGSDNNSNDQESDNNEPWYDQSEPQPQGDDLFGNNLSDASQRGSEGSDDDSDGESGGGVDADETTNNGTGNDSTLDNDDDIELETSDDNNGHVSGGAARSAETMAAEAQAKEDIKKAIDKIKEQLEAQAQKEAEANDPILKQAAEGKPIDITAPDVFGGCDRLSTAEMAEIARENGVQLSADELTTDVDQLNRDFYEAHKNSIKSAFPELSNRLEGIADSLKVMRTLADWKQTLRRHFNEAMKGSIDSVRSKRAMSQNWRDDRYNPYKEVETVENKAANIFYLIDGSGSMYGNGDSIFLSIFKQIIVIEKQCKVLRSARAYFTTGMITGEHCKVWDLKTPTTKILDYLADRGPSGGTEIPENVIAVTKLKPPYYYQTNEKHTTIIVFTDGEDGRWQKIRSIPAKIRKDVVFVVMNDKQYLLNLIPQLVNVAGIPVKNIVAIDTSNKSLRG